MCMTTFYLFLSCRQFFIYIQPIFNNTCLRCRKIGRAPGFNQPRGKVGRGRIMGENDHKDPHEKGMTREQVAAYRAGKRRDGKQCHHERVSCTCMSQHVYSQLVCGS